MKRGRCSDDAETLTYLKDKTTYKVTTESPHVKATLDRCDNMPDRTPMFAPIDQRFPAEIERDRVRKESAVNFTMVSDEAEVVSARINSHLADYGRNCDPKALTKRILEDETLVRLDGVPIVEVRQIVHEYDLLASWIRNEYLVKSKPKFELRLEAYRCKLYRCFRPVTQADWDMRNQERMDRIRREAKRATLPIREALNMMASVRFELMPSRFVPVIIRAFAELDRLNWESVKDIDMSVYKAVREEADRAHTRIQECLFDPEVRKLVVSAQKEYNT